jgi:hypothetical protein
MKRGQKLNNNHHSSRAGINIATFDHRVDAEELKTFLETNGFDAWLQDERRLQLYWFFSPLQAGIHVRVPEQSLQTVQQYIESNPDASEIMQRAIHCPSCHSCRIEYPALTRKNMLPTLIAQVAVALRFVNHKFYCESCHYTWDRSNRREMP